MRLVKDDDGIAHIHLLRLTRRLVHEVVVRQEYYICIGHVLAGKVIGADAEWKYDVANIAGRNNIIAHILIRLDLAELHQFLNVHDFSRRCRCCYVVQIILTAKLLCYSLVLAHTIPFTPAWYEHEFEPTSDRQTCCRAAFDGNLRTDSSTHICSREPSTQILAVL